MARRNRETLKNYFTYGARPTQQEFADLVDSSLNILDDGFSKDPERGVELSPAQGKDTLVSFFGESIVSDPQWEISIDREGGNLHIKRVSGEVKTSLLKLNTDGSVELGEKGREILFPGVLKSPIRRGTLLQGEVPADGRWHDLEEPDVEKKMVPKIWTGCQALEIVASAGIAGSCRHAILIAHAATCFGKNSKIKKVSSRYGCYGNRIRLRWRRVNGESYMCKLQMKTVLKYGDEGVIRFYVTSLWE